MSKNQIFEELKKFLKSVKLSNYEIKVYMTLLASNELTAREISKKSRVPTGRIYDILAQLKEKEIIEIQESHPKIYKSLSPELAFDNLISRLNNEKQREIASLLDLAKLLESKIHESELLVKENSRIFWSTAFGTPSVLNLYIKKFKELQDELLMTGFLNENTLKILPYAKNFYNGIFNALNRGVQIKYLWSFEFDERPLSDEEKNRNILLFNKLISKLRELFNLSTIPNEFELKFIHKRIPTYYDIFDKKLVLVKLQNPLEPQRIFVGMNVLDPDLANALREKFLAMWMFEAIEE